MFLLSDYDYHLPEDRIAQVPVGRRDQSRLLYLNRQNGALGHHTFADIADLLSPSDVLVVNDTKVIPARLFGRKATGGKVECLILDYHDRQGHKDRGGRIECRCLIKASKRLNPQTRVYFEEGLKADVLHFKEGIYTVRFECGGVFDELLDKIGYMPLPPYISRDKTEKVACDDRMSYQTVYASQKGAIAAPTAGLHFTRDVLGRLKNRGVLIVAITLHVGYGTFLPVRVNDIRDHQMHSEWYVISEAAAHTINTARASGRRVVAVGTTSVRTLEYAADENGRLVPGSNYCDLFICPGYRFRIVDAMVTNFHLPKSTLLMLVSAFAGRENIQNAYQAAIDGNYRFYSYGDAMLIA